MPSQAFESTDPAAAFDHFAPLVSAIPQSDLEGWNADADIVRVNARRAVDALTPHWARVEQALPLVSVPKLKEIPSLALAVAFAAERVFKPASPHEIRAHQASLRPARRLALNQLDIFSELGLVSADRVRAIRADRGPVDEANDAVAIVALFREHAAAWTNKHPFSEAFLQRLADDGQWLLGQLVPKGATPEKAGPSADVVVRNRLWTELNRRYDDLFKAGVEIWGRRQVDAHLPTLLTRLVVKADASEPVAPEEGKADST
jgi:hypothetical protein